MLPWARFFFLLFLCMNPIFPLIEPFLLLTELLIFPVFSSQTRPFFFRQSSRVDHHTMARPELHNSQPDPPQIRPPNPSTTPDHPQTQQPNQTIRSDRHHHTRPPDQIIPTDKHPWLLSFKSAQHNQSLGMVQVRCIPYGLGQGGYIELWMNLAKHTFHTRSAWSFRTSFSA